MATTKRYTKEEIREAAETSLISFIRLVAPQRVLGAIHEEVINWWTQENAHDHQLLLLPRGHQKSMLIAYRAAWEITRNPSVTILYASATSGLAEAQLKAIKDILTSPIYQKYWPEMLNDSADSRERWTNGEISVDHPKRKVEGVRDPTVKTAGLTTNITGFHCDVFILDDVVVRENAYKEEEREKVKQAYSLFASIENPGAREWIVGTRYHPKDLYTDLMEMTEEVYDEDGNVIDQHEVFDVFQREVETNGDGSGEFLWPRQRRNDGKWFGFNQSILAKKRAQYLDKASFRAQYYNDPNDPETVRIRPDQFNYYDRAQLVQESGHWTIRGKRLNVFASVDFAYSLKRTADYTAIVVIGVDAYNNVYILEIDRFKTDRISEYFDHIARLHEKWGFRKIAAETTAAQAQVVRELKDNYIRPSGLAISIDEHKPTKWDGTKEERILQVLESRYDNGLMWHYKGGHCQTLEEELTLAHPPHDDVKDALSSAVEIAVAPRDRVRAERSAQSRRISYGKFGGVC